MKHRSVRPLAALILAGSMLLSGCSTTENPAPSVQPSPTESPAPSVQPSAAAKEATYYGEAKGFGGAVTVYVTVDGTGKILDVAAEGVDETIGKGSVAIEQLPGAIVAAGNTDVDAVTGATVTCDAIKAAVDSALQNKTEAERPLRETAIAYTPGTYTGAAFGHNNPVTVEVTFTADAISAINITEDQSDVAMLNATHAQIPDSVIAAQSLNVDVVSGATETSNAILNAVADCVAQAANQDVVTALKTKSRAVEAPADLEYTADVAVVGGGGSGLATACYAASNGLKVVVLEAADIFGGMSNVCGGGSLAIGSSLQKENEFYTSEEEIQQLLEEEYNILYMASDCLAQPGFIRSYVKALPQFVDWAMEAGIGYSASSPISVRLMDKGKRFDTVLDKLENTYGATLLTGTRATDLVMNADGSVAGVTGTNSTGGKTTVNAPVVVLCSGGFLSNAEMCEELIPQYTEYWENWSGSTRYQGDGVRMAWAAGAAVGEIGVQPHNVQLPEALHALGIATHAPTTYGTAAFYPALWLNQAGVRFANEDLQNISPEMHGSMTMKQGMYYTILDQAAVDRLEAEGSPISGWMGKKNTPLTGLSGQIDQVIEAGYAWKADTLEELAAQLGMDGGTVKAQVARYNELVELGEDLDFGKAPQYLDCTISEGPFYAFANVSRILAAYGGLDINADMCVLDTQGRPIPGLYAAGLDAGSFMGNVYSVTTTTAGFSVCSGYMAGQGVCKYLENR